jgi:pimeloyl-ACP methyl ester carboxylesterase
MSLPTSHMLEVPGARLYYEVHGTGPVLMLVGHPMGALGFAAIAPLLAEDFTVVTYDPRGFDRSPIDDPGQDAAPDLLADDVRRVLEAVGAPPADVFGSSGGAVTGLALVARSPGLVRTLIAHEAPLALLLPEAEEAPAGMQKIYDSYRDSGIAAAWAEFASFTGMDMPGQGEPAGPQPPSAEEMATGNRFFSHGLLPIALYRPDFPGLEVAPARLIVACGSESKGEFPQRTAVSLAERLGIPPVEFPGGHVGFISEPKAFADVLRRSLATPP